MPLTEVEPNVGAFERRQYSTPIAIIIAASVFFSTTTVNAQSPNLPALSVNGAPASASQAERNNRVFVPAQSVFSQLGETVTFKSPLAIVKSKTGVELARMTLGSRDASMKGVAQTLAAAPFTAHGALMVPLRFVSEAAGATVAYSTNPRAIDIRKAAVAAAAAPAVVAAAPAVAATDAATTAPATAAVADQASVGIPWWVWLLAALVLLGLLLAFLRRKKEPVIVTSSKGNSGEPTITTRH